MSHMVDEMREQAEAAIVAMQAACRQARTLHARAELMRHMLTTAAKLRGQPDAVPGVVHEWMAAWALDPAAWPSLASEMRRFTEAACAYDAHPSATTDAAWRQTVAALDAALASHGLSLADQMAWRSECAHGWWALVEPPPPGMPTRSAVPGAVAGSPFWNTGCAPHCRPVEPSC